MCDAELLSQMRAYQNKQFVLGKSQNLLDKQRGFFLKSMKQHYVADGQTHLSTLEWLTFQEFLTLPNWLLTTKCNPSYEYGYGYVLRYFAWVRISHIGYASTTYFIVLLQGSTSDPSEISKIFKSGVRMAPS